MLINLWSDLITLNAWQETLTVPFRDIDKHIAWMLLSFYKKYLPDTIFVVNWPWSFTNVRVGILALQTLSYLIDTTLSFKIIDKFQLYKSLYQQSFIPRFVIVFVGQRKNLALFDAEQDTYSLFPYSELLHHIKEQDTVWSQDGAFCVDSLSEQDFPDFIEHPLRVSFSSKDNSCYAHYLGKEKEVTDVFMWSVLEAFYAIDIAL